MNFFALQGLDIGSILQSEGPTVKCVLLSSCNRKDTKEDHVKTNDTDDSTRQTSSLNHLIYEMDVDTTPRNSMVQTILGGPITFLGQYEDEGIVVIARRPDTLPSSEVDDHQEGLCLNPHSLQPPLHKLQVYGDILLMRVSPTVEEEDSDDEDSDPCVQEEGEETPKVNPDSEVKEEDTNEPDFFLDYTKEEYIRFASRTDIVYESNEEDNVVDDENDSELIENSEQENEDEETDEEYAVVEDGESDDEEIDEQEGQMGFMNLIFSQLLRKFREKNGRGPDSQELLNMRAQLAKQLGIENDGDDLSLQESETMDEGAEDEELEEEEDLSKDIKILKRPLPEIDANECLSSDDPKLKAKKRVNFSVE